MTTPIPTYKFLLPIQQNIKKVNVNVMQVVACVLFFISIFYFFFRKSYVISVICAVAFANYLVINLDVWKITKPNGVDDYLARYLDWLITTPLLVVTLLMKTGITDPKIYLFFIALDVIMIYFGYLGSKSTDPKAMYTFFAFSCFFYLSIFAFLLPYRPPMYLFLFLFLAWMAYPVVWFLHEYKKLSNQNFDYIISALDIFSKIGYGLVLSI